MRHKSYTVNSFKIQCIMRILFKTFAHLIMSIDHNPVSSCNYPKIPSIIRKAVKEKDEIIGFS